MTEEELDELIELKKAQAKAIEFEKSEDEFAEEYFRKTNSDTKDLWYSINLEPDLSYYFINL